MFIATVQVHQGEAGAPSMMILLNPEISHFLETKDALQNPERMFYFAPTRVFPGSCPL
jgi:hypothetical protein